MAKLTKLITYAYLREETDLPNGIPDSKFEHKIYSAQETLRMLMGDEFYQDFLTNFNNNTLSASYTNLYNPYIKQYVAWQAYEYYAERANVDATNSGFRVYTEEHSTVATDAQMAIILRNAARKAGYYKKLLIDYLDGNNTTFPLYDSKCQDKNIGNSQHIVVVGKRHDDGCGCNSCCTSHRIR